MVIWIKFNIEVSEILSRMISVDAEDYDEALTKVEDMYNSGEIILDSSDYKDVLFD